MKSTEATLKSRNKPPAIFPNIDNIEIKSILFPTLLAVGFRRSSIPRHNQQVVKYLTRNYLGLHNVKTLWHTWIYTPFCTISIGYGHLHLGLTVSRLKLKLLKNFKKFRKRFCECGYMFESRFLNSYTLLLYLCRSKKVLICSVVEGVVKVLGINHEG